MYTYAKSLPPSSRIFSGFRKRFFTSTSTLLQQSTKKPETLTCTLSHVRGPSTPPLLTKTIGQIVDEQAERRPDDIVFVVPFQNTRKTYAQFKADVDATAAGLLHLGLQKGDRVGIWGPNSYEWLLTQYATAKAGLIMVNVNPQYKAHELEYCLKKVQIKVLIGATTKECLDVLDKVVPNLVIPKKSSKIPDLETVVLISDNKNQTPAGDSRFFHEILQDYGREDLSKLERNAKQVTPNDPVNIQFTSGTTGNPKGATLSHQNILNNGYFGGITLGFDKEKTILCSPVPLYHCFGCVLGSLMTVVHGSTLVIPAPRFDAEATLKAIDGEKCTFLYGVPTMYTDQIYHPNFAKYNTKTLRGGFMSGAPCPVELVRTVKQKLGMRDIIVGYGMTETSPLVLLSKLGDPEECCTQTVGTALHHTEVRIANETDQVVPVGTRGEVQVKGFPVMLGYWQDESKTNEFFTPTGWARTGDIGIMQENGYGKIVGRMKDTIIRGGENVFPAEIENCLHEHPAVAEVYIVGVPDRRLGEEICCWIRLKKEVSEEELKKFCRDNLARFKVPKYFVYVDSKQSFPLTVTGKVQKFKMREQSLKLLKLDDDKMEYAL
ncbi:medium-chain acyl-CoA ligase ACSF2, mitochondrial-like [Paramacrobiotus metropolitanus]|uniref:medium-chain acyl-CoA ligase ACSF2, mitochondrial-like n=1 Tax=Paramacrobiotus metropolitanus TaxID=2943436 RepID=UPI00244658CB|nr:medium-chain acyl-CoA ligase ACSF2, mitochondrial-like [Paramacrobiotus metropolitanus]